KGQLAVTDARIDDEVFTYENGLAVSGFGFPLGICLRPHLPRLLLPQFTMMARRRQLFAAMGCGIGRAVFTFTAFFRGVGNMHGGAIDFGAFRPYRRRKARAPSSLRLKRLTPRNQLNESGKPILASAEGRDKSVGRLDVGERQRPTQRI